MPFHAKTGKEIDAFDMDTLLLNDFGSQQGVETTGNQGNGFTGHGIADIKKGLLIISEPFLKKMCG